MLHLADSDRRSMMSRRQLAEEARNCRALAVCLEGRPERSFLVRLADAFDELAAEAVSPGCDAAAN
jgi:hypothetical protein